MFDVKVTSMNLWSMSQEKGMHDIYIEKLVAIEILAVRDDVLYLNAVSYMQFLLLFSYEYTSELLWKMWL